MFVKVDLGTALDAVGIPAALLLWAAWRPGGTGARTRSRPYTNETLQFDCRVPNGEGLTIHFAQVQSESIVDD